MNDMTAREKRTPKALSRCLAALLAALALACSTLGLSGCLGFNAFGTNNLGEENFDYGTDDGTTSMTLLVYMVGSDLESESGCATTDLEEMQEADLGDRVTVAIEAGGTTSWQNSLFSDGQVVRAALDDEGFHYEDNLGSVNTGDVSTLSDFISWGVDAYPADRYGLILWDHGGGTMEGFGVDELYNSDGMTIGDIAKALDAADTHFDFVGFDACLMGTLETAYACAPYADYLIASEETEVGSGWVYTDWLTKLGSNPSVDTGTILSKICYDYVSDGMFWEELTLSVIDLSKVQGVYDQLSTYLASSNTALLDNGYTMLASARTNTKSFGEDQYDQVDMTDYIHESSVEGQQLANAVEDCVVFNASSVDGASGLAMYYPYNYPEEYSRTMQTLEEIGMTNSDYLSYFNDFLSVELGGYSLTDNSNSAISQLTGADDESLDIIDSEGLMGSSWYTQPDQLGYGQQELQTISSDKFNSDGDLIINEKTDGSGYTYYALSLDDDEWDGITMIETQVLLDDGEGYINLGMDNRYEFDDDGELMVDFDYMWVSINGSKVPFYSLTQEESEDGSWTYTGFVPAYLNDETFIYIYLYWDDSHEDGYVAGYATVDENAENTEISPRSLHAFEKGDEIYFYFDYYSYDGAYESSYMYSDPVTVGWLGLSVSYEAVSDYDCEVSMCLIDVYNNYYWTEAVGIYL